MNSISKIYLKVKAIAVLFLLFCFTLNSQTTGNEKDNKIRVFTSVSKALKNIDEATVLNLSNRGLTEFPKDIFKLKNLHYLVLDSNQITVIPNEINALEHLESLSLSNNKLKTIPANCGNIITLRKLYLDYNEIDSIPIEFYKLTNLEVVYLNNNLIKSLHQNIKFLTKVHKLVLSNNAITTLPNEIGYLYDLEVFSISDNKLKLLPTTFYELTNLKTLWLSKNTLFKIDRKINKLTKLTTLAINHNQLSELPVSIGDLSYLQYLYVEKNNLSLLPAEIGNLYSLKELYVGENTFTDIPLSFINLKKLETFSVHHIEFKLFPQVLYDIQNNGTNIKGLKTKELYQAKLLLSQARNKKLVSNFTDAMPIYDRLIKIDTNNLAAISEYAGILVETGEYEKAELLCKKNISKNGNQNDINEIRRAYSNSLNKTNKIDFIVDTYKLKIKKDSTNPEVYFDLGKFYFDQKNYTSAQQVFQKALNLNASHVASIFYQSAIFLKNQQNEYFIFSSLRLFYLDKNSVRAKSTFPFMMSKMKMKSGVTQPNGSVSYNERYIMKDNNYEIVYQSENPSADLLSVIMGDLLMKMDDKQKKTDTLTKQIFEQLFYTNKSNVEILQLELSRITKINNDTLISKNESTILNYLNYYNKLIEKGYLEVFANLIVSIRNYDNSESWLKKNEILVSEFNTWNKNYVWKFD